MQPTTTLPGIHTEWRAFLARVGATFDGARVSHFGNPEAERRAAARADVIVDLSHLALLRANGADAQSFLQGQLSNDVRQVNEDHAQLSAYCNPKGRMFAIFLILKRGDAYYLQLPAALAEATHKRLRMFILRANVKLESADIELARIGLSGSNSEALIRKALGRTPANAFDSLTADGVTIVRMPGPQPRFELLAPPTRLEPLWQEFATTAMPVGAGPWAWLDIEAGIPAVLPGTVEEFVPQMMNLELVGGVSFNKGCYPGQEIVARMHYLGRLKQRMFRAHIGEDSAPQPGTAVYAPDFPDQSAGAVVDAQPAPDGGWDLLAVIQQSSAEQGEVHLGSAHGPVLRFGALPYALNPAA